MHLDTDRGYDLIGDVHGCAHSLEHLLDSLGLSLARWGLASPAADGAVSRRHH